MTVPAANRIRASGVSLSDIAKVAGVTRHRVSVVSKAAKSGEQFATLCLIWAASEVAKAKGRGMQTDIEDFC